MNTLFNGLAPPPLHYAHPWLLTPRRASHKILSRVLPQYNLHANKVTVMLLKIYISIKCRSFEHSSNQRIMKKYVSQFPQKCYAAQWF